MVQHPPGDPDPPHDPSNDKGLQRKREILDAASRVFRRRGLHATGMRDIAEETGMHVGNLYYYFENKEELLAFCQEDALSGLLALAREAEDLDIPTDEKLRRLIVGHVVRLNEETPGSLAHLEVEALTGAWRQRILEQRRAYEEVVRRLISEGVREGIFSTPDPKVAAMILLGALNWTVKWFRPDAPMSARDIGEEFAEHLVGGLRHPAAPAAVPAGRQEAGE